MWGLQESLFSAHICIAGNHTACAPQPSKTEIVINFIWKFSLSTFATRFISLPPQKLCSDRRHLPWRHTRERINIIVGVWIFSPCKCIIYFAWLCHNRKSKANFHFFLLTLSFCSLPPPPPKFCIVHIARFFFSQFYFSSCYLESKIQTYPAPWGFKNQDVRKDMLLYLFCICPCSLLFPIYSENLG